VGGETRKFSQEPSRIHFSSETSFMANKKEGRIKREKRRVSFGAKQGPGTPKRPILIEKRTEKNTGRSQANNNNFFLEKRNHRRVRARSTRSRSSSWDYSWETNSNTYSLLRGGEAYGDVLQQIVINRVMSGGEKFGWLPISQGQMKNRAPKNRYYKKRRQRGVRRAEASTGPRQKRIKEEGKLPRWLYKKL